MCLSNSAYKVCITYTIFFSLSGRSDSFLFIEYASTVGVFKCNFGGCRTGGREPAGRSVCKRASSARLRAQAHCGTGADGRAPLRHLQTAARLPRVRLQDPDPLLRDRVHQARLHRGQQAQGEERISLWGEHIVWYEATRTLSVFYDETWRHATRARLEGNDVAIKKSAHFNVRLKKLLKPPSPSPGKGGSGILVWGPGRVSGIIPNTFYGFGR